MTKDKDIKVQINEYHKLLEDLKAEKITLPDEFVAGVLIEKLPESWKDYKQQLKHKHRQLSLSDLITHIIIEDRNRKDSKAAKAKALAARANMVQNKPKKRYDNKKPDHNNNNKNDYVPRVANPNFKRRGTCFVCGKPGHHAPQCRHRAKNDNPPRPKANLVEADGDDIIAAVVSQVNIVTDVKKWVVDSGATRHICANKDAFTSYTPVGDDEELVYMGDSRTAPVSGKGQVLLKLTSGKHLSEVCKVEYPLFVKYSLWLLAEVAVIAADIPEVIGTAFALNILFNIPLWAGVLLTGCSTLLLLSMQRFGVRKLELLITILVFVMAGCFFAEMSYVQPPASGVLKGMFVPKLSGEGAVGDAIALLGALIMPHNLFLHSALVLSRKVPSSVRGINDACRYFLIESGFALFVAFLINVAMISVSGTVCFASNLSAENIDHCEDLTLNSASFLLKNVLGRSSSTIYAIALLASGQSSTITGTYAGQYIMQGFLDIKMKRWKRNLMTRCIAIAPSLVVSIIGGSSGSSRLIIIASMILSFELPFALIPLLKFSSSSTKMGPHKNSFIIIVISWILGSGIIGINVYYLSTAFVKWLIHSSLPKVANVFIGIIVFPLMAIYITSVIYLTFRKDTVKTYIETKNNDPTKQTQLEKGILVDGQLELSHAPYREDLADIPLPD